MEERLKVCEMTTEAREVQIETLIALKDRQKLNALIKKMIPHTVEHNKAHIALANTVSFLSILFKPLINQSFLGV